MLIKLNLLLKKLHKFFGVSEQIINGTANKDEVNVYINAVLDPIAISLGQELTAKALVPSAIEKNEYIYISTIRIGLQNTESMAKYAKDMAIAGQLTVNEVREQLGYAPFNHKAANIPRGNLNTVAIDGIDEYQEKRAGRGGKVDAKE